MASNIEIQYGNFTIGNNSFFYTIDHVAGTLIQKNISGAVIQTYALDTLTQEVISLQFDGYFFWTLDKPISLGFRVRKWEIGSDTIVRVISDYLYPSDVINKYEVYSISVEAYSESLDNLETIGTSVFDVADGQVVSAGDSIVIGPSTAVGFVGEYSFTSVSNKVGNTLTVSSPLSATFSPGDPIHFTKSFFAYSDSAPGAQAGALYRFDPETGAPMSVDVSNMYGNVRAATFFKDKLMFIRGSEVIWLNPESQTIFKTQAIDNATESRSDYLTTHDINGSSETLYRLEEERVYYNETLSRWETEDWSPLLNLTTSSTSPEVFFVAVKAEPQILHKFTASIATEDLQSVVEVTVLDQFRTPVFDRVVDLTSTGGPLSSIQETTDVNGQVRVIYTANSFPIDVTITAEVA